MASQTTPNSYGARVTLYVHAGIAAADAICAGALGKHAKPRPSGRGRVARLGGQAGFQLT